MYIIETNRILIVEDEGETCTLREVTPDDAEWDETLQAAQEAQE
jgi:hypothetical protein